MDAEPGRCRRTDGKKWRCKLAVLPNQKYCERHVHRGRKCSRKLVEVGKTLLQSTTTPNLESDAKTTNGIKHNKVCIQNGSFKIKKHGRDKTGGPVDFKLLGESVIQHGNVQGCETTSNDKTLALVVADLKRRRKTDGKKWQCRKEEQKYCVEHIQGGAKNIENGQKSNTGLSILAGANHSHQQTNTDGIQSIDVSSSSSEATTISS